MQLKSKKGWYKVKYKKLNFLAIRKVLMYGLLKIESL